MMNIKKSALAITLMFGGIVNAQAAVTGQVDVKLNVSTGCTVGGSKTEGNMNKFGTLDFGKTSGTWNNVLTAEVASATTGGALEVTCDSKDPVNFTVAIDGGERTDRTLKNTASADLVTYNVYRDAARTNLYAVNQPQQFSAVSGEATAVPVFGAIAPNTGTAKAQGDYKDTLLVTVNF
ncbi:spore coat protein U domain-containing protein [Acinetobacter pittii]|uniref:Csu type fimbrial protein n=1 Tax=Acinetobacter calcoaceticus/baumannii complex TaxID=909768 RepID=UPI0024473733|nr:MULTISPECIES: spore coat protein U domain-containing protein [Acinetobacter calcoaceticus/baumannii complex]MDH2526519.1 spore coat protein U domain-containing protein [Acinetobacter baumannii]MDV8153836.1 spore coat protein U domain-containing protein [Acinetobacter pittii]